MKINNNIQALNAYRNLNKNQFQTSKNLEKLSSGMRINRAADDAAGLAISEKMRSQIRGLKMAERNAMDGISLLQTAEGAMQEVHSMLQRMRELAVQGANDTNTDQDRSEIQKEIRQLLTEIDSVAEKTEFNTRKLLNGSSAVLSVVNYNHTNVEGLPTIVDPNVKTGNYAVDVQLNNTPGNNEHIKYNITQPAAGLKDQGDIKFDFDVKNQQLGEYTINVRNYNEADGNTGATVEVIGPNGLPLENGKRAVAVGSSVSEADRYQTIGGLMIDVSKIDKAGTVKVSIEAEATFTISQDKNTASPSYRDAKVDGQLINVPTVTSEGGNVTVDNIKSNHLIGLPDAGYQGGLKADEAIVAVLKPLQNSNEPLLTDPSVPTSAPIDLPNTALSMDLGGLKGEYKTAFGTISPEFGEAFDEASDAAFQAAVNASLSGRTQEEVIQAAKVAAQKVFDNNNIDNPDISAENMARKEWDDIEKLNLAQHLNPIVEAAAKEVSARGQLGGTYFSVTNSDNEQLLFRVAKEDLGSSPDSPKALVNSSTGIISVNTNADPKASVNDVRQALSEAGYSGAQAWEVASDTTKVERDMLVVTNDTTDNSTPILRKPKVISTADYQPQAFMKTLTTVNGKVEHGGMEFDFNSDIRQGKSEFSVINNALAFQIGPNTNQNVMIDVDELNTVRLGIDEVRVTTQGEANDAIFKLDEAIQKVSSIRAKLGATQNRMEHTINNLQVTHENLTASESRIRDADMALEMTEFTRNNILNQSATAMLAQANQLPQGVLQLLQ